MNEPNLKVRVGSLELKNPVLIASGTFGYGEEAIQFFDLNLIGGFITPSILIKPKRGNPPPRIVETSAGLLSSLGYQNIGIENFIKEKLPNLTKIDTNIIVNLVFETENDLIECIRLLKNEKVEGFEINLELFQKVLDENYLKNSFRAFLEKIKSLTDKAIILKISPKNNLYFNLIKIAKEAEITAISAFGSHKGMSIDIYKQKSKLSQIIGDYTGPAIKPLSLAMVFEIIQKFGIPVIGCGGITNFQDALEYLIIGTKAIQVGTHNFVDPKAPVKIVNDIRDYLIKNNLNDINSIIGCLKLENE